MPTEKLNGNFFIVPNSIFQKKLKPRDFAVYCCLTMHSDKNGYCYPSRKLIAEECCIDKKRLIQLSAICLNLNLSKKPTAVLRERKHQTAIVFSSENIFLKGNLLTGGMRKNSS